MIIRPPSKLSSRDAMSVLHKTTSQCRGIMEGDEEMAESWKDFRGAEVSISVQILSERGISLLLMDEYNLDFSDWMDGLADMYDYWRPSDCSKGLAEREEELGRTIPQVTLLQEQRLRHQRKCKLQF